MAEVMGTGAYGPMGMWDTPLKTCDICWRSEIENIITAPAGTDPSVIGLIPMQYFMVSGEAGPYTICEDCQKAEDGREILELCA